MTPILALDAARRVYPLPRRRLTGRRPVAVALAGATLAVMPGEVVGIVGESGSGKSTLARLAMGFERPDAGRVLWQGQDIARLPARALATLRPGVQMVYQDPFDSLDPRRPVGWSVAEPLIAQGLDPAARAARAAAMLAQVGLSPADAGRYPHEFSGGQRQRIAIARALAPDPALVIADEPVAALDVSVQAQVLNLLIGLQKGRGLAMLFISHDLAVVAAVADRIAVMQGGVIVEDGPTRSILTAPAHPYTRTLFAHA